MNHPYQVMPPLAADQYEALFGAIKSEGRVLVPVAYDDQENIIDGHNRVDICLKLGIENWPRTVHFGLSEQEKRAMARMLNLNRRHLSTVDRRRLIADQLKDTPTLSDRAIAATLGIDHKTVGTHRKKLVGRGEIPHAETMIDTLGREQKRERAPAYVDDSPEGRKLAINRARDIKDQNRKVRGLGVSTATDEERGDDFYQSTPEGVWPLPKLEEFSKTIWEPACGKGRITDILIEHGYKVKQSDLIDRGAANQDGEIATVEDFLKTRKRKAKYDIITNPPFNLANEFIAHAMKEHRPNKIAMFLNLNMQCGFNDPDRCYWMDEHPPSRIYVFSRRLPMMHREGYEGKKSDSPQMLCMWCIWELGEDGEYPAGPTHWQRIDWMDYVPEGYERGKAK